MRSDARRLAWVTAGLAFIAFMVLVPLWAPVVLSAWFAMFMRPMLRHAATLFGGRRRSAAAVTVGFLLLVLAPVVVVIASAVSSVIGLVRGLLESASGRAALEQILHGRGGATPGFPPSRFDVREIADLVRTYGARAFGALQALAGAGALVVLGLFLFTVGVYSFLVHGRTSYAWLIRHTPLSRQHTRRLVRAFGETGRGLFIGIGFTATCQGVLAGIAYAALGIQSAFVLGALTAIAALIPTAGTLLVWGPVAAALAITGQTVKAIVMVLVGVLVIGTVDNVLRPIVSRWGRLTIPMFPLMLSMFGGLATFGAGGILLGPLILRLALEAIAMAREERIVGNTRAR